ncbi:hypothetical protein Lesp02_78840 [Lentzea sp. NBRC 105346]|uniref:hypothetical protein n=1 Tax=Lentzea sp. NBRC 105346 TaxID=3032205 RepID=UPI0024A36CC1|nr:hypothetical protein [Lentzea sp. NBRC 105346]GLZ35697.1 hypothetical protein Lesp02_78840 [Lentzea sp. NBRC 105346]
MTREIAEFVGSRTPSLDLALQVERQFRIRYTDDQVESLSSLSRTEFVELTAAVIDRTRATEPPSRTDVLAVLAEVRGAGGEVIEDIESMELLWLLNSMEQRYGVTLDIDEANLARMRTVDGAVGVLGSCVA